VREHGVISSANVIIRGRGEPFGTLQVDSTGLGQFPRQVGRVRQVDSGAFRTAGDMIRC
jgi:hypothetical protein